MEKRDYLSKEIWLPPVIGGLFVVATSPVWDTYGAAGAAIASFFGMILGQICVQFFRARQK